MQVNKTESKKVEEDMESVKCNEITDVKEIRGNNFSILGINIRSLQKRIKCLNELKIAEICKILCITETWDFPDNETMNIKGMKLGNKKTRIKQKGGGVAIYVDSKIESRKIQYEHEIKNIEICGIETDYQRTKLRIWTIYRAPKNSITAALNELETFIEKEGNRPHTFIVGDTNIDVNKNGDIKNRYLATMQDKGFTNVIDKNTRLGTETCIDHILSNSNKIIDSFTIDLNLADHKAVGVNLE